MGRRGFCGLLSVQPELFVECRELFVALMGILETIDIESIIQLYVLRTVATSDRVSPKYRA